MPTYRVHTDMTGAASSMTAISNNEYIYLIVSDVKLAFMSLYTKHHH